VYYTFVLWNFWTIQLAILVVRETVLPTMVKWHSLIVDQIHKIVDDVVQTNDWLLHLYLNKHQDEEYHQHHKDQQQHKQQVHHLSYLLWPKQLVLHYLFSLQNFLDFRTSENKNRDRFQDKESKKSFNKVKTMHQRSWYQHDEEQIHYPFSQINNYILFQSLWI
jgi:hypothetical protein